MEPLGVFSSAGTAADLCKNLLVLCKNVKNAGAETDQLRRLVANFQKILKSIEEMRSSPNNAKLKHTHQLADSIHKTQSLLQNLVADLSPPPEKIHRILRKIKGSSIRWPFEKEDILKRMNNLERCMQIISESLQVDQTNILLDIDYRTVLDRLPVASDACFDSFDESRKARCLPDTRVDLLQEVSNWANNPDSHAIFWLNGMAGTGKSTISRTISETFVLQNRLGASFFFKRGEADRGGLAKFFTTIAADLIQRQPAFAPRVKEAIDSDPRIFAKSAGDQFRKLIVGPLSNITRGSGLIKPIVIVIDALDECDQDRDIELIIWLFSQTSQPTCPKLKFFLTSRPELPLRLGFKKIAGTYKDLILHEVPATIIENDILTFLEHELSNIRDNYNLSSPDDLRLPETWPSTKNIEILVKMAVPLFIFASTTCRFIADCRHGDPQRQLQRILQYETKATGSRLDATYLPILDQQIDGLLVREKNEVAEEFRAIIGTIIILANPLSITALSRMLCIPKESISNRLDMLHSVLSVPSSLDLPVRMLHLSFRDFLLDPEKRDKTPLWIDEKLAHAKMVDHCLRLLDNLKLDICDFKSPSISTVDIPRATINYNLPPELQYSCLYWVSHAQQSGTKLIDGGPVSEFLLRHFLHWFEALSLLGRTREIIGLMKVLQTLVEPEAGIKTSDFLKDAKLFALTHAATIELWPLQTYSSALVFTPSDSIVRTHFKDSIPSWISFLPLVEDGRNACKQVLEGHDKTIECITFSHDSAFIASGCSGHILRVWDLDTGECLQRMTGHTSRIRSVNFSHDSSLLVSASSDHTIRIWHTETGDCIRVLDGHSSVVASAIFSHDSSLIASASYDQTVGIWSVKTGQCRHGLLSHPRTVVSVAFSHDSTLVASASYDGAVRIWSADSGASKSILHQNDGRSAILTTFSPDSTRLAAIYECGVLRFWRVDTESCEREIQFGITNLRADPVSLSHDWMYWLSAERDKISLCRIDTEQCVQTFNGHIGDMSALAFSYDSTSFASASFDSAIGIWDVAELDQSQPMLAPAAMDKHGSAVDTIAFSHDSSLIATSSQTDNSIIVWSAMTGRCIQKLKFPGGIVHSIVFSHDCSLMAAISTNEQCCVWETNTGLCIAHFSAPEEYGVKRAFSHDLKYLATFSAETIYLWHVAEGVCVRTFGKKNRVTDMIFSDDSAFLGATTYVGTVFLWKIETGELIFQFQAPITGIKHIALSHDLRLVAIATFSEGIYIISLDKRKCICKIEAPPKRIYSLQFTYDASFIAAGMDWKVGIFIWRIDTGQLVRKIYHRSKHWSLGRCWNVDANTQNVSINSELNNADLCSRGYDLSSEGRWIIWDGHCLLRLPKRYGTEIIAASDRTIVLGYKSGRVIILTTSTKDLPDFALAEQSK